MLISINSFLSGSFCKFYRKIKHQMLKRNYKHIIHVMSLMFVNLT